MSLAGPLPKEQVKEVFIEYDGKKWKLTACLFRGDSHCRNIINVFDDLNEAESAAQGIEKKYPCDHPFEIVVEDWS